MCQRLGTSPYFLWGFSIRISEVWHTFDTDGGKSEGEERLVLRLVSAFSIHSVAKAARGDTGRATCSSWTGGARLADRTACLPLDHLCGTRLMNQSPMKHHCFIAWHQLNGRGQSQLWTWACAEYNQTRGQIFPEPHCQRVASTQLKLAAVAAQTSLQPRAE